MGTHITVGMPVYQGQDYVAEALRSLQAQTHTDFDVIISIDGGDDVSAEACRPFLADSRFRMVVHAERLDWVGNFNWLLQQPMGDFFCYRQHDDTAAPEFFATLLAAAEQRPDAAIVYADCQFFGESDRLEATPSIEGKTLQRLSLFIENIAPTACRGLVRKAALMQAGPVGVDAYRSNQQIFVWLLKVLRWGAFLRVPEPIYFRRIHADNYHKQNAVRSDDLKLDDWTTLFTGFLQAVQPCCKSVEQRLYFQHYILDRLCIRRQGRSFWVRPARIEDSGKFMLRCFERLEAEGLGHLWLPPVPLQRELKKLTRMNAKLKASKSAAEAGKRALAREVESLRASRPARIAATLRRLFRRFPGR
jgi:glycosyltransferase involved in cell wall biosynthesis